MLREHEQLDQEGDAQRECMLHQTTSEEERSQHWQLEQANRDRERIREDTILIRRTQVLALALLPLGSSSPKSCRTISSSKRSKRKRSSQEECNLSRSRKKGKRRRQTWRLQKVDIKKVRSQANTVRSLGECGMRSEIRLACSVVLALCFSFHSLWSWPLGRMRERTDRHNTSKESLMRKETTTIRSTRVQQPHRDKSFRTR